MLDLDSYDSGVVFTAKPLGQYEEAVDDFLRTARCAERLI